VSWDRDKESGDLATPAISQFSFVAGLTALGVGPACTLRKKSSPALTTWSTTAPSGENDLVRGRAKINLLCPRQVHRSLVHLRRFGHILRCSECFGQACGAVGYRESKTYARLGRGVQFRCRIRNRASRKALGILQEIELRLEFTEVCLVGAMSAAAF
jgi:hypothetical protein